MQHFVRLMVLTTALAGCAAHEIYDRSANLSRDAVTDWKVCQAAALAATGASGAAAAGAAVEGAQVRGEVVNPESTHGGMYDPEDFKAIKRREQLRQDCMKARGYRYLGVPAVERL